MKIHKREMIVNKAEAKFGLDSSSHFIEIGEMEYADVYFVFNEIERYWIAAARRGLSETQAATEWPTYSLPEDPLTSSLKMLGDVFATSVAENQLTYGEIARILSTLRSSKAKYHIRAERHPEDPDKPGGVE
ncbi:hypothetical protein [Mesorhizobium sp. SP-1A]|uniref:hypothetical protein n=1 Tax=Mesorhizobium sp. SP-1A TaxID=3077840 RepID=UPI0028F6D508|nr:hypothetical protein [Mesorhizobium sp. SP-1A]